MTMASSLAKRSLARSMPNVALYSRVLGKYAPARRSFWMRRAMMTSTPSSASRREVYAFTPSVSMAGGIIGGGAATLTSAPSLQKA
jgi:hypothetical protein